MTAAYPVQELEVARVVEDRGAAQKPVCVDARLERAPATGVAAYAEAMVAAFAARGHPALRLRDGARGTFGAPSGPVDRARRWLVAGSDRARPLELADGSLFARDVFRLAQVRFARTGRLLSLVAPGPPGVMHWTYPIPAHVAGWRNCYTVHDVIPLTHPELSPVDGEDLSRRIRAIAARADRIVTVSAVSRDAILTMLDVPPTMVVDCGSALPPLPRGDGSLPSGLVRGGYFLFCGMDEPRKNLSRIVAAWRASGTARPLAIAGPDDVSRRFPDVRWVGYLPRAALVDLIAGAHALVFPTLEEGFGLPVIEAMALGTPVITSGTGALAETAGDAASGVDPRDTAGIAAAIARLDMDGTLAETLRHRGRERARAFGAEAFGRRLLALHEEMGGDSPRAA